MESPAFIMLFSLQFLYREATLMLFPSLQSEPIRLQLMALPLQFFHQFIPTTSPKLFPIEGWAGQGRELRGRYYYRYITFRKLKVGIFMIWVLLIGSLFIVRRTHHCDKLDEFFVAIIFHAE